MDIPIFFGRFHPLIVHLPIGFLLMAVFFGMLSLIRKYRRLRNALPVALLLGSISAALACITGYVLSLTGDYDIDSVDNHMWAGICVAFISFLAYFMSIKKMPVPFLRQFKTLIATLILLLIFINITGHLGGSLTHGPDYLTSSIMLNKQKQKKISDINEAYVFRDIVHPILEDKCGSCHNSSKRKGKLSMESYDAIIKGGKHGRVLKPGDTSGSEIIKRISLDPQDEKFMPADNKTPLTVGETAIIKWWIEKAAGKKDTKLTEMSMPDKIKNNIIAYLEIPNNSPSENYTVSNINAPPVAREVIEKLEQLGYVIKYLHFKPDLLDISLMPSTDNKVDPDKIKALLPVKDNIIWLNVSGNNVSDTEMEIINQFKNIHQLKLYKNPITDKGIAKIQGLTNMTSINLYDTKITKACLPYLIKLPALKTVYAWGTGIKKEEAVSQVSGMKIITGE